MEFSRFEPSLFEFLDELADNNERDWFQANKARYERNVREPCLAFIRAFRKPLEKISPFFVASDRRVGGSLMRVYRDTRFSRDKTPYKTNVGIQFRHELGKDVHAPGFYVHIAAGECFLGVGIWRPDAPTLKKIRHAIADEPGKWKRARNDKKFQSYFELAGESLKTVPRGYAKDHPLADDLRRKDFVAVRHLDEKQVLDDGFLEATATAFAASRPWMRFLCRAAVIPF